MMFCYALYSLLHPYELRLVTRLYAKSSYAATPFGLWNQVALGDVIFLSIGKMFCRLGKYLTTLLERFENIEREFSCEDDFCAAQDLAMSIIQYIIENRKSGSKLPGCFRRSKVY